jgi:ribulose 1,5-bisphosphate synthetase/thiazole synthase
VIGKRFSVSLLLVFTAVTGPTPATEPFAGREADVVVYGTTAAGLAAAIQAKRMEASVIVVEASTHVGGMTTGGLSSI